MYIIKRADSELFFSPTRSGKWKPDKKKARSFTNKSECKKAIKIWRITAETKFIKI